MNEMQETASVVQGTVAPDREGLMAKALAAVQGAHWQEALDCYGRLLAGYPGEVAAYLGYGNCLLHLQRSLDEAEDVFRQAVERFPENRQAAERVAHVTLRRGEYETALRLFDALRRRFPDYSGAVLGYCDALIELGRDLEAEPVLRDFLKTESRYYGVHAKLIHMLSIQGRHEEMLAAAVTARECLPDDPSAHAAVARALICLWRYEEAQAVYAELDARFPTSSVGLAGLVWVSVLRQIFPLMERFYREIRQRFPTNLDGPMFVANKLYKLELLERADEVLTELVEAFPDQIRPLLLHAHVAVRGDDFETALARFQAVIRRFPGNYEAQSSYGRMLLKLGRAGQAEAHFLTLLDRFPSHPGPSLHCARLACLDGRHEQGLALMRSLQARFAGGYPGQAVSGPYCPTRLDLDHEETLFSVLADRFPDRVDIHLSFARMML
jgi:tetratricopeptide (TPR) repeat protein